MKQYWINWLEVFDGKVCQMFYAGSLSWEEVEKSLEIFRQNDKIVSAWVCENDNKIIHHEVYVDTFGGRDVAKYKPRSAVLDEKGNLLQEIEDKIDAYLKQNYKDGITIYPDYQDELVDKQIAELLESKYPLCAFDEKIFDAYSDGECRAIDDATDKVSEALDIDDDYWSNVREYVRDNLEVNYPYDHFYRQEVRVDIYVDTGDANYDFVCNAIYPHYNGRKMDYDDITSKNQDGSIFWLAETQGYEEEAFFNAIMDDCEHTNSKFIKSVYDELANMGSHMPCLVFLKTFTLKELLDVAENDKDIEIPVGTTCGLYDSFSGGGSLLEIELEKPLTLPHKYIHDLRPAKSYRYSIEDCYGMMPKAWEVRKSA